MILLFTFISSALYSLSPTFRSIPATPMKALLGLNSLMVFYDTRLITDISSTLIMPSVTFILITEFSQDALHIPDFV